MSGLMWFALAASTLVVCATAAWTHRQDRRESARRNHPSHKP